MNVERGGCEGGGLDQRKKLTRRILKTQLKS